MTAFALGRKDPPPRQWLPGFVRWPVRVLLLPFVLLDLAMQRLVRPRLPYRIEGQCKGRGDCCRYVLAPVPVKQVRPLTDFYLTQVQGFYRRRFSLDEADVFSCRYLQENGRCAHYWLRPAVCRQWASARYDTPPTLLPGCGFVVVPRSSKLKVL